MAKYRFFFLVIFSLLFHNSIFSQIIGQEWSNNVTLKCVTDFGRGGAADVWGWEDTQTGIN